MELLTILLLLSGLVLAFAIDSSDDDDVVEDEDLVEDEEFDPVS